MINNIPICHSERSEESSIHADFGFLYNKFILKITAFCLVLLLTFPYICKSQTRDNELWSGINLDIPIIKNLELELNQEIRLNNNIEIVDWHISDIGLAYSFNKEFKISGSYNYRSRKDAWQHVFNANFNFDEKFRKIKYSYRLRYQEKYRWKITKKRQRTERRADEDHIRNKLMFEYDTDMRLTPFTGFELYYLVNSDEFTDRFDVIRYYLGVDIDTFEKQKLTLYWMYEMEFNIIEPNTSNVIGIFYSFELSKLF